MSRFRVIQISDTHLSRRRSWFVPNFHAMVGIIAGRQPDLVVNTGDISFDGADLEDDLAFARACHAGLGVPLHTIPGNHDVGDNPWQPDATPTITESRLSRYRRYFGDDHWHVETEHWVLIGLNAQLFGSGLPAEANQWAFLEAVTRTGRRGPIALFVHKPLFDAHPDESDVNHRFVPPEHRRRLLGLLEPRLRLVASGHVHQHRRRSVRDVEHCWAPSTAFVLPDHRQPRVGTKRVGYVDYTFGEQGVTVRVVEPPELTNHDLDAFPEAYPH